MSFIEPTRIIRMGALSLEGQAYILLRQDSPLPARLAALDILRINLDQMLRRNPPDPEELEAVADFMRKLGYEVEDPPSTGEMFGRDIVDIVAWFHRQLKRREDEDILSYIDRVAKFVVRLLAVYKFVAMGE